MNSPEERDDVPVLTEIVEDKVPAQAPVVDAAGIDALADQLERALLERLGPEIDRVTARAADRVRADLTVSVLQMVREAVAASVSQALGVPKRD
jgi:hypothetical protein